MFDFENSATYILMQLSLAHRNSLERALNVLGLHSGQIFVLISLWRADGLSQIDLVKSLKITAPTVNNMVKSLSASGFIELRKCESDGRLMRVFLTVKGVDCQKSVAEQWGKIEAAGLSNLTDTEKLILAQLLGKMKENLSGDIKTL